MPQVTIDRLCPLNVSFNLNSAVVRASNLQRSPTSFVWSASRRISSEKPLIFSQPHSHVLLSVDSLPINWSGYFWAPKRMLPSSKSMFQSCPLTTWSLQAVCTAIILPRQAEKTWNQFPVSTARRSIQRFRLPSLLKNPIGMSSTSVQLKNTFGYSWYFIFQSEARCSFKSSS